MRRAAHIIFAIALIIRLLYVAEVHDDPFDSALMFDSALYDSDAHTLINEGPLSGGGYILGPLYVYFLAAIHLLFGHSVPAIMAAQAVLGALTCALACIIGREMFDERVGVTAGVLCCIYGPLAFYTSQVLSESLLTFMHTLLVWRLTRAYAGGGRMAWLAAGIVLGVSAWGKPNILVTAPLIGLMIWARPGKSKRMSAIFSLYVGLLLALAPVMARNAMVGSSAAITGNLGVNLFVGNNPSATGAYVPLNELIPSSGSAYYIDGGPGGTIAQADPILAGKAFSYAASNPAGWAALMARKLMLMLNAYEIPDMDNYNFERERTVLRRLIPSMALIAPFGILGAAMASKRRESWPAAAYLLAYGLSFCLFFVKARFRIPMMPTLMIFAAYAVWELHRRWRVGRVEVAMPAAALAILLLVVNNPWFNASSLEDSGMTNPYNNLGRHYEQIGLYEKALRMYQKAIVYKPGHGESYNNLGELENRLGRYGEAEPHLRKAISLDPQSPYAHGNLAASLSNEGRFEEAKGEYARAISLNPYYWEARASLGALLLRSDDIEGGLGELRLAESIHPGDPDVGRMLAYAAQRAASG